MQTFPREPLGGIARFEKINPSESAYTETLSLWLGRPDPISFIASATLRSNEAILNSGAVWRDWFSSRLLANLFEMSTRRSKRADFSQSRFRVARFSCNEMGDRETEERALKNFAFSAVSQLLLWFSLVFRCYVVMCCFVLKIDNCV